MVCGIYMPVTLLLSKTDRHRVHHEVQGASSPHVDISASCDEYGAFRFMTSHRIQTPSTTTPRRRGTEIKPETACVLSCTQRWHGRSNCALTHLAVVRRAAENTADMLQSVDVNTLGVLMAKEAVVEVRERSATVDAARQRLAVRLQNIARTWSDQVPPLPSAAMPRPLPTPMPLPLQRYLSRGDAECGVRRGWWLWRALPPPRPCACALARCMWDASSAAPAWRVTVGRESRAGQAWRGRALVHRAGAAGRAAQNGVCLTPHRRFPSAAPPRATCGLRAAAHPMLNSFLMLTSLDVYSFDCKFSR